MNTETSRKIARYRMKALALHSAAESMSPETREHLDRMADSYELMAARLEHAPGKVAQRVRVRKADATNAAALNVLMLSWLTPAEDPL